MLENWQSEMAREKDAYYLTQFWCELNPLRESEQKLSLKHRSSSQASYFHDTENRLGFVKMFDC